MNDKMKSLLAQAGFCFWEDEPWGPGEGKIDWSLNYDVEIVSLINMVVEDCLSDLEANVAFSRIKLRNKFGVK